MGKQSISRKTYLSTLAVGVVGILLCGIVSSSASPAKHKGGAVLASRISTKSSSTVPSTGGTSKTVPHYHDAAPYLVTSVDTPYSESTGARPLTITVYKLCDGPNLIYTSSISGNPVVSVPAGVSTQIQFDSPECK